MEKRSVTLAGMVFANKTAATKFYRAFLQNAPIGVVYERPSQEFAALYALLECHHDSVEKIGYGVEGFVKRPDGHPMGRNCCWWVRRVADDPEEIDFSYIRAIDDAFGVDRALRDFRDSCRRAVREDVAEFKKAAFGMFGSSVPSAISGEDVSFADAEVDHAPPLIFANLVDLFIAETGTDIASVEYRDYSGVDWGFAPDLEQQFLAFHKKHATLRVISATENRSGGRWGARPRSAGPDSIFD